MMDVTIGHVYNVHPNYKSGNLRQMEGSKRQKYLEHYQQQRYAAFAPMVANSLGQRDPDCHKFLCLTLIIQPKHSMVLVRTMSIKIV